MTIAAKLESPTNSTIVRSNDPLRPPPLRAALSRGLVAGLDHLSPELAARVGLRQFLTPPRHEMPEREREWLARGRALTVRAGGRRVAVWRWGEGPAVCLIHGWGGRGAQLGAFIRPLLDRGLGVVAFDAPAHGQSEGQRVTFPEMAVAFRAVADHAGPLRGLVAHSGGAAVSGWAVREWARRGFVDVPDAIALIAPAARPAAWVEHFSRALGLSEAARAAMRRQLRRRAGEPPEAFDLPALAGELSAGALIVHDRGDAEVPWADGAAVAGAWPGAELVTTHGLGHRRILRDPAVVARITDFLAERLAGAAAPVPAGALLC